MCEEIDFLLLFQINVNNNMFDAGYWSCILCWYQCKNIFLLSNDGNMLPVKVVHQFYNPWCNACIRGNNAQESGEAVLVRQSRRCWSCCYLYKYIMLWWEYRKMYLNVLVSYLHQVPKWCLGSHWLSCHWALCPNNDNLSLTPVGDMLSEPMYC